MKVPTQYKNILKASILAGMCFSTVPTIATTYSDVDFKGAVYVMSNNYDVNTVIAYGRQDDGLLSPIGEFATGGQGGNFHSDGALDPLIAAYSLLATDDRRHLLTVNAGSNTVSVFKINNDFSLTLTDEKRVLGFGPNSIAYTNGLVYVSSVDTDGEFEVIDGVFTEKGAEGNLTGFKLSDDGKLTRIPNSVRFLENRPSGIQFSPDGRFLVSSAVNAGVPELLSGNNDEISVFSVDRKGRLSKKPVSTGTSTQPGNAEGRNQPGAIGFEIVADQGKQYVVVSETRVVPPLAPTDVPQVGSVSTWELDRNGNLIPMAMDVKAAAEVASCWIEFNADESHFWLVNTLSSTLSEFSFDVGTVALEKPVAVAGSVTNPSDPLGSIDGWTDLWLSDDGKNLYQLFNLRGTIGVIDIDEDGNLTLVQEISGIPQTGTSGLVAL